MIEVAALPSVPAAVTDSGWFMFLIVVAIFVLPFVIGSALERALKLKDIGFRIGVVLLVFVLGLAPFADRVFRGQSWKDAIRLGIDLAGGTNLVYQVDTEAAKAAGKNVDASMDQMIGAIIRRVNPAGTKEVTVRQVGADRIEVIVPGEDLAAVEETKRLITRLGSLEFEILANERDHGERGTKNRGLIQRARQLTEDQKELVEGNRVVARWRAVTPGEKLDQNAEIALRTVTQEEAEPKEITEVLTVVPPERDRVTGKYLVRAYQTMDEGGRGSVGFNFNQRGAFLFQALTSQNQPLKDGFHRHLAIVLDEQVHSAPRLITTISSAGQITGDFSQDEINELINVLNAGALEIPIQHEPISEFSISPLLGADVQEKGMLAIQASAIGVLGFMLVYYFFAGLVANLCLLLNLVLIMGTMSVVKAAFTLPGLAGIVLTIGMAVDANVLIFERIREESARGSSLRMAIQNGFGRAFSAIVDANVTTIIVAVVLYVIGTDQVRGFAVTLFIGIVMSMFSALYFGRLVFDICERKRWIKNLKMLSLIGTTNIDFLGKTKIAAIGSLLLILCGLTGFFVRGSDNLDIDFRGGTMVTFEFVQPQPLEEVRADLEAKFGSSITLERLTLSDEEQGTGPGRRYRLRTTEEDVEGVRHHVAQAFPNRELLRVTMEFGKLESVPEVQEKGDTSDSKVSVTGFEGGRRVALKFSGELTEAVASDWLADIVQELKLDYPDPKALFQLTGIAGSGLGADERKVKKFSEMQLLARPSFAEEDLKQALASMQADMAETPLFEEVNKFAKAVGSEMQQTALAAILISMGATIVYLWFRFQRVTFGLAAVAAVAHDVLVVLGLVALVSFAAGSTFGDLFALVDFKINLPMIAAFLTVVGYSLNDTIVIFDRIREVRGKNPALTDEMVNSSINQTLSRTILTSLTTLIVVAILYFIGGEGIHGFAFCLVFGVITGTYSTIYIANPVLLWLTNRSAATNGQPSART